MLFFNSKLCLNFLNQYNFLFLSNNIYWPIKFVYGITLAHGFIFTLVFCAKPAPAENAVYDQEYPDELFPGDTVTYRCDDGYRLIGSATIVCQYDGRWNASIPTCEQGNFDLKH